MSSGKHCNDSYYTASHDDLKAVHNTPIPIYVTYQDGSSILKDTQDICGFGLLIIAMCSDYHCAPLVDVVAILIAVGAIIGVVIFSCCLGIGITYLKIKLRQRRAMA